MKTKHWLQVVVALICLGVTVRSSRSSAATVQVPECATDPACVALFEQARQQSSDGNLEQALRLYKQAYQLRADPRLLFSIARVLQKQSSWEESISYYQLFIDSALRSEDQKQKAREYIEQCRAQLELAEKSRAENRSKGAQDKPPTASSTSSVGQSQPTESRSLPEGNTLARPIHSKWWFWVAIGGAAIVAAGVTAGVILGTRAGASMEGTPVDRMIPSNSLIVTF